MNSAPLKRPLIGLSILFSITLVLFIKTNLQNLDAKPGSFEFVRKGEGFLDKDKYTYAVIYFEKAYRSSPENKVIKSDLVFAYSRYARELAKAKQFDKAIEYLTKSYEIMKNSNTAQNLAIMHAKKAEACAEANDWYKAEDSFANARLVASDSESASKNLGIWLFNEAVNMYKSMKENLAILYLKESELAYEDSRSLEFLGDIYYKKTDFEKASFYWNKALEINPASQNLREKINKLKKEYEYYKTQEKADMPHFELRYEKGLLSNANLTRDVLEHAYRDVGRDLAYFPSERTVVFIYSEDSFRNIFNMPSAVRAFYDGNIRLPFPDRIIDRNEFTHYIYHEYTHAVVSAKTNNNCPVWLNEGIAVWEEYKNEGYNLIGARPSLDDNVRPSIHSLDEAFQSEVKGKDMRLYYYLAYTVVSYIVENWGVEGLRDILARIATGQHVINAIDDEFLLPEQEFEKRWNFYIRNRR